MTHMKLEREWNKYIKSREKKEESKEHKIE